MPHAKAVLSDIGNVILSVHTEQFLQRLADMAGLDIAAVKGVMHKAAAVEREVNSGTMTIEQVFDEFIADPLDIEWQHFAELWIAMLGEDFPQVRQAYENLTVPLYVLSNTNDVHAECLHGRWFEKISVSCWLSNEIGMSKPDAEVYTFALSQIECRPDELLFFDDLKENVDSALSLGINAVLAANPDDVVHALRSHNLIRHSPPKCPM